MLRLVHREGAGRPPRVRWALEEAGADYEFVVLTSEEAAGEAHRARHPLNRVPVLESDDGALFESAALCLQVADLFPDANLIPPVGTYERGLVYQWTVFAMSELEPAALRVYRAPDDKAAATARAALIPMYAALEQALASGGCLVPSGFTVADIVVCGVLTTASRVDALTDSERIAAYMARLAERPAWQRAYG